MRVLIGLCIALAACQAPSGVQADTAKSSREAAAVRTRAAPGTATGSEMGRSTEKAVADDPCGDESNPKFDPDKCVEPDARVDDYIGTWQVTNVAVPNDGVQAFGKDDPAIVGSRFAVSRDEIRWVGKASGQFTADDVCTLPSAAAMPVAMEASDGAATAAAARSFAGAAKGRGTLHRFGCMTSGRWGPGEGSGNAFFYPVGGSQMILQWYDNVTLLAKKVK